MKLHCLVQDTDCHWYVIPVEKKEQWDKWCKLDPDLPIAWDVPDYAIDVGGCPSQFEFILPEEG